MDYITRAPARRRSQAYRARGTMPANMHLVPGPRDTGDAPVVLSRHRPSPILPLAVMLTGATAMGAVGAVALRPMGEDAAALSRPAIVALAPAMAQPASRPAASVPVAPTAAQIIDIATARAALVRPAPDRSPEPAIGAERIPAPRIAAGPPPTFDGPVSRPAPRLALAAADPAPSSADRPRALAVVRPGPTLAPIDTSSYSLFADLRVTLVLPQGSGGAVAARDRLGALGAHRVDERRSDIPAARPQVRFTDPGDRDAAIALARAFEAEVLDLGWTTSTPQPGDLSLWLTAAADPR